MGGDGGGVGWKDRVRDMYPTPCLYAYRILFSVFGLTFTLLKKKKRKKKQNNTERSLYGFRKSEGVVRRFAVERHEGEKIRWDAGPAVTRKLSSSISTHNISRFILSRIWNVAHQTCYLCQLFYFFAFFLRFFSPFVFVVNACCPNINTFFPSTPPCPTTVGISAVVFSFPKQVTRSIFPVRMNEIMSSQYSRLQ